MRRFVLAVSLLFPLISLAGKNPADYPLRIQVIESHWNRPMSNNRRNGGVEGWGRGNIRDGDSIHAFDFTYSAPEPFHRTVGDAHYPAKWKKEGLKLEMLVGEIGSADKFREFDLKTSVRPDVYERGPDGAVAISQAEYSTKQAHHE